MKVTFAEITDPGFQNEINNGHRIFTSLEGENPGGSIKDHMVRGQLESWIFSKQLKPHQWISELSAGSTAQSLAYYCREYQIKCALFLPNNVNPEIPSKLKDFGVTVELLSSERLYENYETIAASNGFLKLNQLFDPKMKAHYQVLGKDIHHFLPHLDLIIGATGTGHSLTGIVAGMSLHRLNRPQLVSAEPGPSWKVPGCRNLEVDRYGDRDPCVPELFDSRIILDSQDLMWPTSLVMTDQGPVHISDSFRMVLGALKKELPQRRDLTIFAVGSTNKRIRGLKSSITSKEAA